MSFLGCIALIIRWSQLYEVEQYVSNFSTFRKLKSTHTFLFLVWNLFLAWIPYWFAILFQRGLAKGRTWIISLLLLGAWLLFLPNAPYIITDFLHLRWRHPIPHWYDLMVLFIFAYTGLKLGLASLQIIYTSLSNVWSKLDTRLFILLSIFLTGQGVYLGRVLRYNSWDIIHQPFEILISFFNAICFPFSTPGAGMAWILSSFLALAFLMEQYNEEKTLMVISRKEHPSKLKTPS